MKKKTGGVDDNSGKNSLSFSQSGENSEDVEELKRQIEQANLTNQQFQQQIEQRLEKNKHAYSHLSDTHRESIVQLDVQISIK